MATMLLSALVSSLLGCSRDPLGAVGFGEGDPFVGDAAPEHFGAWTSFDTSPDGGRLTLSYYDRSRGAVGYAVGTAAGPDGFDWVHERVDGYEGDNGLDSGDRGKHSAQRTLPDGTVWVAYHDAGAHTLRARHRLGPGNWEESLEVDGAGTGQWTSMAVDAGGNPLIVYCTDDGIVREARGDGKGGWAKRDLYAGGAVEHTRVTVAGGKEYVVFRDADDGELHLLTDGRDEVVDDRGDTGAWPSLAVDGGDLWIAYQDVGEQDLRLAEKSGSSWSTSTIDAGELRGADTWVAVTADGPEILYFDGFDNDLRRAHRDGSAWAVERLAGEGVAVGFHNRLVPFGSAVWWFSYDYTNDALVSGRL